MNYRRPKGAYLGRFPSPAEFTMILSFSGVVCAGSSRPQIPSRVRLCSEIVGKDSNWKKTLTFTKNSRGDKITTQETISRKNRDIANRKYSKSRLSIIWRGLIDVERAVNQSADSPGPQSDCDSAAIRTRKATPVSPQLHASAKKPFISKSEIRVRWCNYCRNWSVYMNLELVS